MTEASTNPQVFGAAHPQRRIDHRERIGSGAHPAGADRMMDRDAAGSNQRVDVGVRVRAGRQLARDEGPHRGLRRDGANHPDAVAQGLTIAPGAEKILPDARRRGRVGRPQAQLAAAFRAQQHGAAREAVLVGPAERPEMGDAPSSERH